METMQVSQKKNKKDKGYLPQQMPIHVQHVKQEKMSPHQIPTLR
jgi:hypothetical protein